MSRRYRSRNLNTFQIESILKVELTVRKLLDAISQNLKGKGIADGDFAIAEMVSQEKFS
jgi:hypothetical protein